MTRQTTSALALLTGVLVAAGTAVTVVHGSAEASAPAAADSPDAVAAPAVAQPATHLQSAPRHPARRASHPAAAAKPAASRATPTPRPLRYGAPVHPVGTSSLLAAPQGGRAAVAALGANIDVAAQRSGVPTARLRQLLTTDPTARVARNGNLFYVDPRAEAGVASGTVAPSTPTLRYPTSTTFALHSRPGAARTIYLDMDGAAMSGTSWDQVPAGSVVGANGGRGPASFTTAQDAWVQEVWHQVAETYSPFDVDVTTEDPGYDGYTKTSSGDTTYGTHVVFTSDTGVASKVCGIPNCVGMGGVGFFGRLDTSGFFDHAWVFASTTSTDPSIAAQGASHEAGHTFGLHHDGTTKVSTDNYYTPSTQKWGAIMGMATNRALSQWSRGEYPLANNHEDDVAIIGAATGFRPDEAGSTTATAAQLGAGTDYTATGVISDHADVDTFAVDRQCAGPFTASAQGIGYQTTLDAKLSLLDANGTVVASNDPHAGATVSTWPTSTGMDAAISTTLGSGRFYLQVDGVGDGSASTEGLYSDYASLGQYTLKASGCSATSPTASSSPTPSASPTTSPSSSPTSSPSTLPVQVPSHTPTITISTGPTIPKVSRPSAPRIGSSSSGASGGSVTATARWSAPSVLGGAPVQGYQVAARKLDSRNRTVKTYYTAKLSGRTTSVVWRLPRGRYTFVVKAWNSAGTSPWSSASRIATAR